MSEHEAHARGLGKWGQPGVPHRGWEYVEGYDCAGDDLAAASDSMRECEMCETMMIRYVTVLRHDDYPDALHCGCVCAEHMTQDYQGIRARDHKVRLRGQRRARYPRRKQWQTSGKGTMHIHSDEGHAMVFANKFGDGWKIGVTPKFEKDTRFGKRVYSTERDAKLACFDYLMWLEDRE